jgi:5-methylcytosine-specific restriction endonuclease McrA
MLSVGLKRGSEMAEQRSSANAKRFRAIIARTKAACHICGGPIDYTLPYLDPMAFVIDHVIPLHKGGEDALTNIKAAHRSCNSKKRARIVAPIVRRSGSLG